MITVTVAEMLEREEELDALRALLDEARAGRGGIALVEAPPGQGKTSLLRALRLDAGMRVLSAVGAELERDYAFGIVRQLFQPVLGNERVFSGSAANARPVLEGTAEAGDSGCASRLHALYWLAANLAAEGPLAIVVDDAHWADGGSLDALAMLARRIEDLPIALIVAVRPLAPEAAVPQLETLFATPDAIVLHPEPLSPGAVAHLLREAVGREPEPAFLTAAIESTGGNALLVSELRRMLSRGGYTGAAAEADAVRRSMPGTIARMVQGRLWNLDPTCLGLARAAAALGDRSSLLCANALAGLDETVAVRAHASLAAAGLMEPGALRFVHPMMREATLAGVIPATRSALHRRAAALLERAGADENEVAAQLLAADPAGDPWAAGVLTRSGRCALAAGDTEVALHHLRRALAESAEPAPELLYALGLAEARLGDPTAHVRLERAARDADPVIAARAEQARARVLVLAGRAERASIALGHGIQRARDTHPELAAELEDDLLDALNHSPELAAERRRRLNLADDRPAVLAHRAFDQAVLGAPADAVRDLALRALAGGALTAGGGVERPAVLYAIEALMAVEAADEARAAIDSLAEAARRSGSRVGAAGVAQARTHWEHEFGHLEAARDAARTAIELQARTAGSASHGSSGPLGHNSPKQATAARPQAELAPLAALAAALLDMGDTDAAAVALEGAAGVGEPALPLCFHATQARVLLARGRADEAIAQLECQLEHEARRGWSMTFRAPTRATLVLALAEAGRLEEARVLATEQLERMRSRGLHGAEARMLIAQARVELGQIALLQQAVEAARRSPSALIQAEALVELGSALRRVGRRSDAREPLREARELALRVGARALEARAHEELVIAGARPQRVARAGVLGLTPSERRVAELAASGRRNREIAESLFVTLKTVEVHLGRAYGKLGIRSRSQLAAVLVP